MQQLEKESLPTFESMVPFWEDDEDLSPDKEGLQGFDYQGNGNGVSSETLKSKIDETLLGEASDDNLRSIKNLFGYLSIPGASKNGGCMLELSKQLQSELHMENWENRRILWITDRLMEIELRVGCSPTLIFRKGRGLERGKPPGKFTKKKMCQWEMDKLRNDFQYLNRPFKGDGTDRVTIRDTLHRISGGTQNMIIRIGRVPNRLRTCSAIQVKTYKSRLYAIVSKLLKGEGVLVTGKPGVGKTTFLRDVARAMGVCGRYIQQNSNRDENGRCVIVDKHDEICGGGEASKATFPAFRSADSGKGANEPGLTNAVQTSTPRCIIADEIGSVTETDALAASVGLGIAVMATSHFHLDGNKVYKSSTQQALVKLILRHRTLNGLAGGIEFTTISDSMAKEKKVQKNFATLKHAPPFKWCLYMRDTNPASWPDMFDMKYEAKAYVNELNALKKATVGSSGSKHPLNSASKRNRLKKRSRDDFCENVDDTNYNMPMRNRPAQRRRFSSHDCILPTTVEESNVASHAQMYVFHCDKKTQHECLTRKIFGLTQSPGPIDIGSQCFLFNRDKKVISGPFIAVRSGLNLDKNIWKGKYPYQVRVGDGKNYTDSSPRDVPKGTPRGLLNAIKKKKIPTLHSIMGFDTNALNETRVNSIAASLKFKRVRKSSYLGFSLFRHISRSELVCCVFHESQLVILYYGRLNLSDLRVIFRKGYYYRRCDTRKFQDILQSFLNQNE